MAICSLGPFKGATGDGSLYKRFIFRLSDIDVWVDVCLVVVEVQRKTVHRYTFLLNCTSGGAPSTQRIPKYSLPSIIVFMCCMAVGRNSHSTKSNLRAHIVS